MFMTLTLLLMTLTLLLNLCTVRQGEDGAAKDGPVDGSEHVAAHPRRAEHGEGQHGEEQQDDAGQIEIERSQQEMTSLVGKISFELDP